MITLVEDGPRWFAIDAQGSILAKYRHFGRAAQFAARFAVLWGDKGTGPWAGYSYTR